jgi:hypothetical protein
MVGICRLVMIWLKKRWCDDQNADRAAFLAAALAFPG